VILFASKQTQKLLALRSVVDDIPDEWVAFAGSIPTEFFFDDRPIARRRHPRGRAPVGRDREWGRTPLDRMRATGHRPGFATGPPSGGGPPRRPPWSPRRPFAGRRPRGQQLPQRRRPHQCGETWSALSTPSDDGLGFEPPWPSRRRRVDRTGIAAPGPGGKRAAAGWPRSKGTLGRETPAMWRPVRCPSPRPGGRRGHLEYSCAATKRGRVPRLALCQRVRTPMYNTAALARVSGPIGESGWCTVSTR